MAKAKGKRKKEKSKEVTYEEWIRVKCPECELWQFMPVDDLPKKTKCNFCRKEISLKEKRRIFRDA